MNTSFVRGSSLKPVLGLAAFAILAVVAIGLMLARPAAAAAPARPAQQSFSLPDPFEPNNDASLAKFLPPSGSSNLTFATISPTTAADDDWYLFALDPNRSIVMTATSLALGGSLIIEGFSDPAGTILAGTSTGVGGTSSVVIVNSSGVQATYRVRVKNTLGPTQPTLFYGYRLDWFINVIGAATPTPIGASPDFYEPNDSAALALANNRSFVPVQQTLSNLNFFTTTAGVFDQGDVDWYFFYGRQGSRYQVTADVQPGVDTEMFIHVDTNDAPQLRPPDGPPSPPDTNAYTNIGLIGANDDYQALNRGSRVVFVAPYEGKFWIKLWNKDRSPRVAGQTYTLNVIELSNAVPTITPTLTLPATPFPGGADSFEYNGDFDSARSIAPNVKTPPLNFVPFQPPGPDTVDNDFFKLPVKQGVNYTCETLDLTGGTDTNIIVYNQDRQAIGGNDDITPTNRQVGRFESRFSWLSGYTGYAYILIGQVNTLAANDPALQTRSYTLLCTIGIPPTPTPTPNPNPPTQPPPPATPLPPEPTPTPFPTPRPEQPLVVRPVDPASLQPTTQATPTPRTLMIEVQTFLDNNRNGLLDPGEGIAGTPIRLSDERTGTPLQQVFTNEAGLVRLAVMNEGPVRVSVPVFGYSTVVDSSPTTVRIGIQPTVQLPERIP